MSPDLSTKDDDMSSKRVGQDDAFDGALPLRLQEATAKKGWRQAELARRSGIDRQLIGAYWHGKKTPSRENLFALADALDVDPRWLVGGINGTASYLLDQIDALVEAGDDAAVYARRSELEAIAHDPDLSPNLRNRADYLLSAMGDKAAKRRNRATAKEYDEASQFNRTVIEAAFDRACENAGMTVDAGARQAMVNLCGFLLIERPENISADVVNFLIGELVAKMAERPTLHDRRNEYRGE